MGVLGLRTDGIDFKTTDGKVFSMAMVSDFALLARWFQRDGENALVKPRLAEWMAIAREGGYDGPITLRVFRHAMTWNRFALDPKSMPLKTYKAGLRAFLEYVGDKGFYVELTGGDAQALWPTADGEEADPSAFQQHVNEVCDAVVDLPNVTLEVLNERFKNGRAYGVIPPRWGTINPLIRCSGIYHGGPDWQRVWDPSMNLDYVVSHTERQIDGLRYPKACYDMPVAASILNNHFGRPVVLNEPLRFDNETDPEWAARVALNVAWCAGVCFHSQRGRDGDGFADAPGQRRAAVRFFAGVQGGLVAAGLRT
jgi:hypothetical protein